MNGRELEIYIEQEMDKQEYVQDIKHVNSGEIATLFRSTRHTCQEMFSGVVGAKRRWLEF